MYGRVYLILRTRFSAPFLINGPSYGDEKEGAYTTLQSKRTQFARYYSSIINVEISQDYGKLNGEILCFCW